MEPSRIEECAHQQVEFLSNKKRVSIKRKQFLQSFTDNLSARLCPAEWDPNDTFLKDLELFDELRVTTIPTSDLEKTKSVVWLRGSNWTKKCVYAE